VSDFRSGSMFKFACLLLALCAAGGVRAQAAPATAAGSSPIVRPGIDMAGVRASLDRVGDEASPADGGFQPRTAIDYHLARQGMFGQVGYVCRSDASPIANQEATVQTDAKDDRLLGGTLKYSFR